MVDVLHVLIQLIILPALALTTPTLNDVSVEALQDGQKITKVSYSGATLVTEVHYIGLEEFSRQVQTEIRFSGKNISPDETVILSIPMANIEQMVAVQSDGTWQSSIPTSALPTGMMSATIRTSNGTDTSDPLTIAEFNVKIEESLSSATWFFFISTTIAIIALLFAITSQLRYNLTRQRVV